MDEAEQAKFALIHDDTIEKYIKKEVERQMNLVIQDIYNEFMNIQTEYNSHRHIVTNTETTTPTTTIVLG